MFTVHYITVAQYMREQKLSLSKDYTELQACGVGQWRGKLHYRGGFWTLSAEPKHAECAAQLLHFCWQHICACQELRGYPKLPDSALQRALPAEPSVKLHHFPSMIKFSLQNETGLCAASSCACSFLAVLSASAFFLFLGQGVITHPEILVLYKRLPPGSCCAKTPWDSERTLLHACPLTRHQLELQI
jgi:hypothetical protein